MYSLTVQAWHTDVFILGMSALLNKSISEWKWRKLTKESQWKSLSLSPLDELPIVHHCLHQ